MTHDDVLFSWSPPREDKDANEMINTYVKSIKENTRDFVYVLCVFLFTNCNFWK